MMLDVLTIYAGIAITAFLIGVAVYHPNPADRHFAAGAAFIFAVLVTLFIFGFLTERF